MSAEPRWVGRLLEHDFISSTNRFLPSDHTLPQTDLCLFSSVIAWHAESFCFPLHKNSDPRLIEVRTHSRDENPVINYFYLMLFQSSIKNIEEESSKDIL